MVCFSVILLEVTEFHAYDFVIKDFVIKKGCYLCWTLYFGQPIFSSVPRYLSIWSHTLSCYSDRDGKHIHGLNNKDFASLWKTRALSNTCIVLAPNMVELARYLMLYKTYLISNRKQKVIICAQLN